MSKSVQWATRGPVRALSDTAKAHILKTFRFLNENSGFSASRGSPRAARTSPKPSRNLLMASLASCVRVARHPKRVLGTWQRPKCLRTDLFGPSKPCPDSQIAIVRGAPSRSGRFSVEVQYRLRRKLFVDLIVKPFESLALRSPVQTFFFGVGGSGRRPSRVYHF